MRHHLIILLILFAKFSFGQLETPFFGKYITSQYKSVNEDSAGFYYIPETDTTKIVFISKDYLKYKLYDNKTTLLVDGEFRNPRPVDYSVENGKWTEYYPNGKIKTTGYYYWGNPIGLWEKYYTNGKLKEVYSLTLICYDSAMSICKTGSFQEYYASGQLKVNGFYYNRPDTASAESPYYYPPYREIKIKINQPTSKPFGIWTYYKENGEIEKEVEYKNEYAW